MSRVSDVQAIVRFASRRWLLVLVLETAALPCAVALAGAALLLIFGTDILSWFWPALLAGAAAAYAAVRIRRRMLPPYRVAQVVDRRLGLNDSLATAWFLLSRRTGAPAAAVAFQIEQAEQLASSVRPAAALPFAGQRKWILTGGLLAVALSLFTVRYFQTNTLSLRPALVPVPAALLALENLTPSHWKLSPFLRSFFPEGESGHAAAAGERRSSDAGSQTASASSSSKAEAGTAGSAVANRTRRGSAGANSAGGKPDAMSSPSLLRRMKDALSSLAADLRARVAGKRRSPDGNKEASAAQPFTQPQPSDGRQTSGQRGANNRQQAMQKQGAGMRSSQTSSRKGSQPLSGIGSRNGDKDLKRAEDLAAMGKLAKILGKRAAGLTGDMSVQSTPGTALLSTPETGRLGQHENTGGEIRRDEIPPMYRDYVKRYMEAVRNQTQ